MQKVRLNKFLAERIGCSRREADLFIEKGMVFINHRPAKIGQSITPEDEVVYNDQKIPFQADFLYLAFHKPVGYVCSRKSQGDSPTLYELLPEKYQILKTVGRLDKDSSGLILLTNDGDFAFSMTHPKFHKHKLYEVELDHPLEPLHQQMIADYGVELDDGKSQLGLSPLGEDRRAWQVTMSEGRNRQIRRTFSALGYTVEKLKRLEFGKFKLKNLAPGKFTEIKPR